MGKQRKYRPEKLRRRDPAIPRPQAQVTWKALSRADLEVKAPHTGQWRALTSRSAQEWAGQAAVARSAQEWAGRAAVARSTQECAGRARVGPVRRATQLCCHAR